MILWFGDLVTQLDIVIGIHPRKCYKSIYISISNVGSSVKEIVNFLILLLQNDDFTDKVICLCLVLPNMQLCSFGGDISRKTAFKMRDQFVRIVGKPSLGQFSLKEDSVGASKHEK